MKKSLNKIIIIYTIAVILRIITVLLFADKNYIFFEPYVIGKNLADGLGYTFGWYGKVPLQPTALFPPIYTLFIASILSIFKNPDTIFIVQSFLNAACVFPAYILGSYIKDKNTGLISSLLVAAFPQMVFVPAKLVSENFFIPLFGVTIYSYISIREKIFGHNMRLIFYGILVGLLTLTKSIGILLLITAILDIFLKGNKIKYSIKHSLFILIAFLSIMTPWMIRNTIELGYPIMTRTGLGFNLWRGNHQGASGTGRVSPWLTIEKAMSYEYKNYIQQNLPENELEIDNFYKNEALRFIRKNPIKFTWLSLKRLIYFLTIDPTHYLTRNVIYIASYIFLMIFGISGIISMVKKKRWNAYFTMTIVSFIVVYSVVMVLPRYRLPLTWLLLCFSSIPLSRYLLKVKVIKTLIT